MYAQIIYENVEVDRLPQLTKNDFGQTLKFYIRTNDNNIFDLSDCTSQFFNLTYINHEDKNLLHGICTLDSATGLVIYTISSNDLIDVGSYNASLELNFGTDSKYTIQLGYIDIIED